MERQQRWATSASLAGVLLLAACGAVRPSNGSISSIDWMLEGVSPDQRHLVVSTLFGGEASGCSRFEGWDVSETEESVEVVARLWQQSSPSGCTAEGIIEHLQVDLEQPLGDRELVGCGVDDCRSTVSDGGRLAVGQIVFTGDALAIVAQTGLESYALDGSALSESSGATSGQVVTAGNEVVVRNDRQGAAIAVDLRSGEEIWRSTGWLAEAAEDVVYVCRGQDSDGLTAVDAADGSDLWATDLPCGLLVVHGELLTIIGIDRSVDGGHRLTVVDATNGALVVDEAISDGIDDRVTGFDQAIAVGTATVVAGSQADLVVLADDGIELAREPDSLGAPMGEADGVAILGAHDRLVGYSVHEAAVLWTLGVDAFASVSVSDGSVWLLDQTAGAVVRLDPFTGAALWSLPIGLTTRFDVASGNNVAYIVTTQAVIAADNNSGEILWSQHRRYEPAP